MVPTRINSKIYWLRFENYLRPELLFVWDIDLQNDEDDNLGYPKICSERFAKRPARKVGISQDCNSKKVGISQKSEGLQTWDIPGFKHRKKMVYPKNFSCDLLPDVIKSVTGFGRKSGNRHFAKRISPTRIYR